MSPKPVDKEEKRKIILDAALKVYKENGFSDSKVEDIAKKANIGKGTVYEYFRSKEEIAVKLIENSFNSQIQILKKIKIKEDPPLESLKSFISSLIEEVDLLSVIIPLHFEIWSGKKGKAMGLNKIMSERFEKLSFYFNRILNEGKTKNIFRKDLNRRTFISVVISSIDGIILYNILYKPKKSHIQTQLNELEKLLTYYLLPNKEENYEF